MERSNVDYNEGDVNILDACDVPSITNDLTKIFGMKKIIQITECGKVKSIRGDGNCGYQSYRRGLADIGLKVEDGMSAYRKDIYDFVTKMRNKNPGLGELITTMDGSATEQYLFAYKIYYTLSKDT